MSNCIICKDVFEDGYWVAIGDRFGFVTTVHICSNCAAGKTREQICRIVEFKSIARSARESQATA